MPMPPQITGGVDTHLDVHVAAALDDHRRVARGRERSTRPPAGYADCLSWLSSFGRSCWSGWRAPAATAPDSPAISTPRPSTVVEVDRPNRQRRRRRGKSDTQDAITAARAAQSGDAHGEAKTRDGNVESMRVLRVARLSARKARTQALNQMRSIISTAPDRSAPSSAHLNVYRLLERASAYRPGQRRDVTSLTKVSLRTLARRALALEAEIAEIDAILEPLVARHRPRADRPVGIGVDTAVRAAGRRRRQPRTAPQRSHLRSPLRRRAHRRQQRQTQNATASTVEVTAKPTPRCGASSSPAWSATREPATTSSGA